MLGQVLLHFYICFRIGKVSAQLIDLILLLLQLLFVFHFLFLVFLDSLLVLALEDFLNLLICRGHVLVDDGGSALVWLEILRQILRNFLLNYFHSFLYKAIRLGSFNTNFQ